MVTIYFKNFSRSDSKQNDVFVDFKFQSAVFGKLYLQKQQKFGMLCQMFTRIIRSHPAYIFV